MRPALISTVLMPVAGAAALLAFAPLGAYPLAWFCLLPLMLKATQPGSRRFIGGWLYGLGFFGFGLFWLPETIASFLSVSPIAGWAGFAIVAGFLALFPAVFCWTLGRVANPRVRLLVLAPALWVALETIRFEAFGGLPWLGLAVTQIDGPLGAWLPVTGETGLDWLIVSINGLIALTLTRLGGTAGFRPSALLPLAAALAIAPASLGLSQAQWVTPGDEWLRLGLVQAAVPGRQDIDADEYDEIARTFDRLAGELPGDVDLIVLPEAAVHVPGDDWRRRLSGAIDDETAALVGVLEDTPGGARYNSAMLMTADGSSVYRKQRPVPVAELRPSWLGALVARESSAPPRILPGRITAPLRWKQVDLGLAICWEVFFGNLVAAQVRDGADLIVNLANESWVASAAAQARSFAVARMRAAENGRMLVRIANRGISGVIGADGEPLVSFDAATPLSSAVAVMSYEGSTPYQAFRVNEIVPIDALLVLLVVLAGPGLWASLRRRAMPVLRPTPSLRGFTLIELVAVITILAVLAAALLPRMAALNDEAEQSVYESTRGAFASGVTIARVQARAVAATSGTPSTVTMSGVPVDVTSDGWPSVTQASGNCAFAYVAPDVPGLVLEFALGIPTAHAGGGGGGGGGGGPACSVLELVLNSEAVSDWTTSVSGSVATFTDAAGRTFSYDETNGSVF